MFCIFHIYRDTKAKEFFLIIVQFFVREYHTRFLTECWNGEYWIVFGKTSVMKFSLGKDEN